MTLVEQVAAWLQVGVPDVLAKHQLQVYYYDEQELSDNQSAVVITTNGGGSNTHLTRRASVTIFVVSGKNPDKREQNEIVKDLEAIILLRNNVFNFGCVLDFQCQSDINGPFVSPEKRYTYSVEFSALMNPIS